MPYGMVRLPVAADGSARGRVHPTSFAFMAMRSAAPSSRPRSVVELFAPARGEGRTRPARAGTVASVPHRSALRMLVRIVAVPDLAVLDLGEGALGYVDRASGAWARVVGDQVVEGGAGHLGGDRGRLRRLARGRGAGAAGDRAERRPGGRQRLWFRRPDGWSADTDRAPANRPSPSAASRPDG